MLTEQLKELKTQNFREKAAEQRDKIHKLKETDDLIEEATKAVEEVAKAAPVASQEFKVVPPGNGIVHQVNIEYLARVVMSREVDGKLRAYPDTVVGTDSHTTMVNGLGVLGWGVGGIEAEAALLGQPVSMLIPKVVGFKLNGQLPVGTTATDLVLTIEFPHLFYEWLPLTRLHVFRAPRVIFVWPLTLHLISKAHLPCVVILYWYSPIQFEVQMFLLHLDSSFC